MATDSPRGGVVTHLLGASGCSSCVSPVMCQPRLAAFGAPLLFLARRRSRCPIVAITMSLGTVATATASSVAFVSTAAASAADAAVVFDVPAAAGPRVSEVLLLSVCLSVCLSVSF